ncbi:nicotinate phosphoribosyltransferase [Vibrio sp. SS-MA-C1-2]|uniref:nicotinate phosphoribosyltransferase n=1 Tax=Vibrio sp. SS-MA-C1-2 TaxID=2908646 RepID=UPI0038FC2E39
MNKQISIITSLLDTDAYKLHMQQAVFHLYPNTQVKAEFKSRGTQNLTHLYHQLIEQIEFMAHIQLSDDEFNYLSQLDYFKADYLLYLSTFRFNPELVNVSVQGHQLFITIEGSWLDVILWEVPLLAIISELFHQTENDHLDSAKQQLQSKLTHQQEQHLNLIEFGTRRRYSKAVQNTIVEELVSHYPGFLGTSNYALAMKHHLKPFGTQAHEWFQAHQQISEKLVDFQVEALEAWLKEYPDSLLVALTDCINMDSFLQDFSKPLAEKFTGLRHDSGDPFQWGDKALRHYQTLGIEAKDKMLMFSDGLTLAKAEKLNTYFTGKIQTAFGIGTHLTCDIPGVSPLNIVLKLTECDGQSVAKISDEPGKIHCTDAHYIKQLKQAFGLQS